MRKHLLSRRSATLAPVIVFVCFQGVLNGGAGPDDAALYDKNGSEWMSRLRKDHPRMFFNKDTWPKIRGNALKQYKRPSAPSAGQLHDAAEIKDWTDWRNWKDKGCSLKDDALFYCLWPNDAGRLELVKTKLRSSLAYYESCIAENRSPSWYSWGRIEWMTAFDWVWNKLTAEERADMGRRMLAHVEASIFKPGLTNRHAGTGRFGADAMVGYYGDDNMAFFAGILFYKEGIDDEKALALLKRGYAEYQKMFEFRAKWAGDDGGTSTATLNYGLPDYPVAEWNFLHVWQSATGENISGKWPYIALRANYVMWNLLPGELGFGLGDCFHNDGNKIRLPANDMDEIVYFYGKSRPDMAAVAAALRAKMGDSPRSFLLLKNEADVSALKIPAGLPMARHFEAMGQMFMRSGDGPDDTYAMFCGDTPPAHRHYDSLHFAIYKRGFLALDSGTRQGPEHKGTYYSQTVAHNCMLINMPGEPPAPYYGGPSLKQAGGQSSFHGAKITAFDTNPYFSYAAADGTPCYSERKCSLMLRQFVFVPPNHFVIFDRVSSVKPEYAKTWLIHHANEPVIDGKTWRSDQDRGRIFCRTLLPEDALVSKVGGPGKEFLVDGVNFPFSKDPAAEVDGLMGRWRVEVSPGAAGRDDVFLHLIEVGGQSLMRMSDSKTVKTDSGSGVSFKSGVRKVDVIFGVSGPPSGHVRIEEGGRVLADQDLSRSVMPQSGLGITRAK